MGRRETDDVLPGKQTIKLALIGTAVSLVLSLLFLGLTALMISKGLFSQKHMLALSLVSAFLGVFFSGLSFSRKHKGHRWMMGAAIGFLVFFLFFLLGFFVSFPPKGAYVMQVMAATVSAGILSGLISGRRKTKRRH